MHLLTRSYFIIWKMLKSALKILVKRTKKEIICLKVVKNVEFDFQEI